MATQRGTCFVWIAVPDGYVAKRLILLQNMQMLAKYVTHRECGVGMAYSIRPEGLMSTSRGLTMRSPEQYLAEENPFLPFGIEEKPGYRID